MHILIDTDNNIGIDISIFKIDLCTNMEFQLEGAAWIIILVSFYASTGWI